MPEMSGAGRARAGNLKYFHAKPIIEWVLAYFRDTHRDGAAGRIGWALYSPSRLLGLPHAPILPISKAKKGRGRGKR